MKNVFGLKLKKVTTRPGQILQSSKNSSVRRKSHKRIIKYIFQLFTLVNQANLNDRKSFFKKKHQFISKKKRKCFEF